MTCPFLADRLLSPVSSNALLIAAVFVPYLILMVTLGVYIYRTGRRRDRDDNERDQTEMSAAA